MMCTSVVPCLSSGLAKIAKLCPYLSYFIGFYAIFKVELFFENEGTNLTPKQSSSIFSQFLKDTTIK